MNSDEAASLLRKLLIMGLTSLATYLHMSDVTWILPVATDAADVAVVLWGVYAHRGMVKVSEAAAPPPSLR